VPFFISWPGKLPAGKVYEQPVVALDVFAYSRRARGNFSPAADLDGVNLLPYLKGENKTAPHAALYWRFGPAEGPFAKANGKLVDWRDFRRKEEQRPGSLYDLANDIGETARPVRIASAALSPN